MKEPKLIKHTKFGINEIIVLWHDTRKGIFPVIYDLEGYITFYLDQGKHIPPTIPSDIIKIYL